MSTIHIFLADYFHNTVSLKLSKTRPMPLTIFPSTMLTLPRSNQNILQMLSGSANYGSDSLNSFVNLERSLRGASEVVSSEHRPFSKRRALSIEQWADKPDLPRDSAHAGATATD